MTAMTVAAALVAAPAMAQGHHGARQDSARGGMMQGQPGMMQGGMMQMMRGMHGQQGMMGGMMGMAAGPGVILGLRESLELTEDQVTRLEALRESTRQQMHGHMMEGMQTMRSAWELLDSDSPDLDAYEARLREASDHMVLAHTAMARAAVEARELLTADQRERLELARSMMQEMRQGEMPQGMMEDGGMQGHMQGGMMQGDGGAHGGHDGAVRR